MPIIIVKMEDTNLLCVVSPCAVHIEITVMTVNSEFIIVTYFLFFIFFYSLRLFPSTWCLPTASHSS